MRDSESKYNALLLERDDLRIQLAAANAARELAETERDEWTERADRATAMTMRDGKQRLAANADRARLEAREQDFASLMEAVGTWREIRVRRLKTELGMSTGIPADGRTTAYKEAKRAELDYLFCVELEIETLYRRLNAPPPGGAHTTTTTTGEEA